MKAHNMTSASRLEQFYVKRTLDNVKAFGAKYMIWQDPLDNNVRVGKSPISLNIILNTVARGKASYLFRETNMIA